MSESRISASAPTRCATSAESRSLSPNRISLVATVSFSLTIGHGVQRPQPVQRALGVGVLHPHRDVVRGQQDLAHGAVVAGERGAPRVDQGDLSDAGRGLLGGQVGGPLAQAQRLDARGDGARGHDDDVGAGLHPRLDRVDERGQPAGVEQAGLGGQRGGADLDDDAARGADASGRSRAVAPSSLTRRPRAPGGGDAPPCARPRRPGRCAPGARRCRGPSG